MVATWKEALAGKIAEPMAREIDIFETQIELRKQGRIEEKLFAETRLRRGAYGQRYDNGQRNDGETVRALVFPSGELTKGPSTLWDAPGMMRIKIPFGRLTAPRMEALAEVAEEHSDAILHVTTRQDFQLHFVHIEDTPTIMRRLAAVGITTLEACGNTVRNITACPYSGVCSDESFDVTPVAHAMTYFLLGHRDAQDFGRKFKVAFSGCREHACGLVALHDLGAIAVKRTVAGGTERGFELYVGGGLGSVPHQAKLFDAFVPEAELLPMAQAIARVFARLGEKKNRARARLKFVVAKLGIDEFKRIVVEERARLTPDPRWMAWLDHRDAGTDRPLHPGGALPAGPHGGAFDSWHATNTRAQPQVGYVVATVRLPLGDLTSSQMRALADLSRRFTGDTVRTTVEQNIVFRWVSLADLPSFHAALQQIGLASAGAGTIADITACPGTDTCKLGISSSRGLASELEARLGGAQLHPSVSALQIKTSGCFNACGQHHIADLGFLGVSRNVGGRRVPHFQVVLGGQSRENAAAYGLAIGAVPSKRIPEVVERLTGRYVSDRSDGETFQGFIQRIGKGAIRALLEDLIAVPAYTDDKSFYADWGDPREYTIGDMGAGECAGEVVPLAQFGLAASEREVFEAQLLLEQGDAGRAAKLAYSAMLVAARALVQVQFLDVSDEPDHVVREFRARLVETRLFADPYAGDKFAQYLFHVHERGAEGGVTPEVAHQRIEEAQLFIEAAHACYDRLVTAKPAA
ncbi:MAG: nitrite/sulfite reductase [Myxococcales bacterium]|nr:nitrite/sulfite reductase [Myxococcales bacterium]